MNERILAKTLSDELSGDVAVAILTKLSEQNRDPNELLEIVRIVHGTLQGLTQDARDSRLKSSKIENAGAQCN